MALEKYKPYLVAAGMIVFAGCASAPSEDFEEDFDSSSLTLPPLSPDAAQSAQATSQNCKAQVESLWQIRGQIPRERLREFHITLGKASAHCNKMAPFIHQLNVAARHEMVFRQYLEMARTVSQGGGFSPLPSTTTIPSQFPGTTPVDITPLQNENQPFDPSIVPGESSGEPLSMDAN